MSVCTPMDELRALLNHLTECAKQERLAWDAADAGWSVDTEKAWTTADDELAKVKDQVLDLIADMTGCTWDVI